ncbi:MAG TPA: hypothetical protein DCY79_08520 [Planctomycetaceae bacterium]|nr:hypothetical protein [Planctomycetaceae bacterium]
MIAMPGRRSAQPQQQTRNEEVVPQPLERPEGPLMVPGREAPDVPDLASEIGSPETDGKRGEMMVHDPLSDALARPEPAPDPGRIVQELPLTDSTPPELKKVTPPDPDQLVESPESMPSDPVVSPSELLLPVATLVRESDAVWRKRPESWLAGQPVELVSGAIELEMKAGAEVTVQGPARFQLDSPHQVKLTSGHLHAVVPRKAIGFTVQTPASQVVDLGTEFDVTVDDQGATGVQVQRGEVELTSKTAEGQGRQWNLKQGDLKWLAADGEVFDWVLTIRSKGQGSGYVEVNGKRKEYGAEDRGQAMLWISEQCRRLFLKMKPENPLRVMFDVDGQRFRPKTAADLLRAQNAVVRCVVGFADVQERLQELQKTFPNASQFFDFEEMKRSMEQLPARSPLPAKESP